MIISGNHNKRVGVGVYPRSRVIAYVMPTGRGSPGPAAREAASTRAGAGRTTAGAPADTAITSPIAELLAVINAERARAEAPRRIVQQLPRQRADTRGAPLAWLFGMGAGRNRRSSRCGGPSFASAASNAPAPTVSRPARSAEHAVTFCRAVRSSAASGAGRFVTA